MNDNDVHAISNVYAFLSRLWLREIDLQWLGELESNRAFRDAYTQLGGMIPGESELEELAADYCRIFVGPKGHVVPIQSVWESQQLQTATSSSVEQFAKLVGFDLESIGDGALADHLGVELAIMGHTVGQISVDASAASTVSEVCAAFFRQHLDWTPRMLTAAAPLAEDGFYGAVIKMTQEFLKGERQVWIDAAS